MSCWSSALHMQLVEPLLPALAALLEHLGRSATPLLVTALQAGQSDGTVHVRAQVEICGCAAASTLQQGEALCSSQGSRHQHMPDCAAMPKNCTLPAVPAATSCCAAVFCTAVRAQPVLQAAADCDGFHCNDRGCLWHLALVNWELPAEVLPNQLFCAEPRQCARHSLHRAQPSFPHLCRRYNVCCLLLRTPQRSAPCLHSQPLPAACCRGSFDHPSDPPRSPRHRSAHNAAHFRALVPISIWRPSAAASGGALSLATSAPTLPSSTSMRLMTASRPTLTTTTLTGPSAPSAYCRRRVYCSATASRPCPLASLTATTQSGCPWVSGGILVYVAGCLCGLLTSPLQRVLTPSAGWWMLSGSAGRLGFKALLG